MKLFNRTPIKLDCTVFEFRTMAADLPQAQFIIDGNIRHLVDFGTVVIVDPSIESKVDRRFVRFIEDLVAAPTSPLFSAPVDWRMSQVLSALGAFKSLTAACDNGWDTDIAEGWTEHRTRIAGVKGMLCTFKITPDNKWFKR